MKSSLILSATLVCAPFLSPCAFADGSDNFTGTSKNTSTWGPDSTDGNGVLSQNGELRYSCPAGTIEDYEEWPYLRRFPYNADWDIRIDAANTTSPVSPSQVNSMGMTLASPLDGDTNLYIEFYNSALGAPPARTGFNVDMVVGGTSIGGNDSGGPQGNSGALRLQWNATTKILTAYYDLDPSDGDQWISFGTFGLGPSGGGTLANSDWSLAATDQFFFSIYGYSSLMTVTAGSMSLDNFSETGSVAGSGGTRPAPTGNFPFVYPTGNSLITRIISLIGNYKGTAPGPAKRQYDIDVAQDESGKLVAMGTMDGVEDQSGSPQITGSIGAVKTVNGEPTAELKGKFNGTRDGNAATASATASGPVEVADIGGGVDGATATATYKGKVAGVPFSAKNVPFELEAPPASVDNLEVDWSVELELEAKMVNGKERIFASAVLTRPDGDMISFPEKAVKFSQTKGYNLKFKKGTNITVIPNAIDTKSSVTFTNLDFTDTGGGLAASAGRILYKFLGQSGEANVTDFIPP